MKLDQVNTTVRTNLGTRIRHLREAQGISQYKFADMIALDRSYLIGVEKGRRNVSLDNIYKIARGLDVSLSTMFDGVDDITYAHVKIPKE